MRLRKKAVVLFLLALAISSSAWAGEMKLEKSKDEAYGSTRWRVINVPKTKDKGRKFDWAEWKIEPVVLQKRDGTTKLGIVIIIRAANSAFGGGSNVLPQAVDIRIDDRLVTFDRMQRNQDDMYVNGNNYGTVTARVTVSDVDVIRDLAKSKEAWMIGYTKVGEQDRRNIEVPEKWKEAMTMALAQYDSLISRKP
jgi:hypothetical protein